MRAAVNILGKTGEVINSSIPGVITTKRHSPGVYLVYGTLGMVPVVDGGWGHVVNQIDASCSVGIEFSDAVITVNVNRSGLPADLLHSLTLHVLVPDGSVATQAPHDELPIVIDQSIALQLAVDIERDRRAAAGFSFNGKMIQSRDQDRENITGKAMLAFMAILNGASAGNLRWADPDVEFSWITADNTLMSMDAQTVVNMGKSMANYKERLIFAARVLKDMKPIPVDYIADKYWPE